MRIAVINFMHETVTFLPNDTTLEDFVYEGSPAAGEALLASDPKGYLGGFVQVAREFEDVQLFGVESPLFPKTGTGSGWVTREAYEHFVAKMLEELFAHSPLDGVYLALHGAMGVRDVDRPEAELARRVRAVVGEKAIIAATFDPHGNEDEQFFEHADLAFTCKYFPHYDAHLQGERAARMLVRAVRGTYVPSHAVRKVPIISPTVLQWTGASPWSDLIQRALTWEAREPDVYVNVFFGFPWADVPDVGMTFQVITNDDPTLAQTIATDMAASAWRQRERLLNATAIHTIEQGVALAKTAVKDGETPVVLADHSDRSGYATWLLRELIVQDVANTLVASVADAPAVAELYAQGVKVGDPFDMQIGGRLDDSAGEPVRVTGKVELVGDPSAPGRRANWIAVRFGQNNLLVVSAYLMQVIELDTLRNMGIEPDDFDIIALKSRVHFRRGFDDNGFAKRIFLVEPPQAFLGTVRLDGLPYRIVRLSDYYPYGSPEFDPTQVQSVDTE